MIFKVGQVWRYGSRKFRIDSVDNENETLSLWNVQANQAGNSVFPMKSTWSWELVEDVPNVKVGQVWQYLVGDEDEEKFYRIASIDGGGCKLWMLTKNDWGAMSYSLENFEKPNVWKLVADAEAENDKPNEPEIIEI